VLKLPNMDNVNKDIMLGLAVSALVAAFFLLVGIYIVGAAPLSSGGLSGNLDPLRP
jgi:hypothetical protein